MKPRIRFTITAKILVELRDEKCARFKVGDQEYEIAMDKELVDALFDDNDYLNDFLDDEDGDEE